MKRSFVMSTSEPKKFASLRILEILKKHSDENHPLTQAQISDYLAKDYGIDLERKAIANCIDVLADADYDIRKAESKKGVYLGERDFEDSELLLLIDAVRSSRHICPAHSQQLIEKICGLSNDYFSGKKRYDVPYLTNEFNKTESGDVFLNLEYIYEGIETNKKIYCDYCKYGIDKKMTASGKGHVISPYRTILHNQRYYVVCYDEKHADISCLRIDKMKNVKVLDETAIPIRSVKGCENGISDKDLSCAMPYMYFGKSEMIVLLAEVCVVDQIIDWFGTDLTISKSDREDHVQISLRGVPEAMVYWGVQYADNVEILSPLSLREKIKEKLERGMQRYSRSLP